MQLLVFVSLCAVALAQTASPPWQDLFVLTCGDGSRAAELQFLPSHPIFHLGIGFSQARTFWDHLTTTLKEDAICHCPALAADTTRAAHAFDVNFDNVLRAWENAAMSTDYSALNCAFEATMEYMGGHFDFQLPASCTSAGYASGDACLIEWSPAFFSNTKLQIAVKKCPNAATPSSLPYISLSCNGGLCRDLLLPCNVDGDCTGGSKCGDVSSGGDGGYNLFNNLMQINWVDVVHSCFSFMPDNFAFRNNMGNYFIQKALDFINSVLGGGGVSTSNFRMCGIKEMTPLFGWSTSSTPFPFSIFQGLFGGNTGHPTLNGTLLGDEFPVVANKLQWKHTASWNGVLMDGSSVSSAARVAGTSFAALGADVAPSSDPNVMTLLVLDCNSGISITPDSPFHLNIQLPKVHDFWNWVMGVQGEFTDCRTAPTPLTDNQKRVRFDMASADFWLNLLTKHSPFDVGTDAINDTSTLVQKGIWKNGDCKRLNLPSSCNLQTYLATGKCAVKYDAFQALVFPLGDVSLQGQFTRCSHAPNAPPRFELRCVGSDCHSLLDVYTTNLCRQNSDCGATGSCSLVSQTWMSPFLGRLLWKAPVQLYGSYQYYASYSTSSAFPTRQQFEAAFYAQLSAAVCYSNNYNCQYYTPPFMSSIIQWITPYVPGSSGQLSFVISQFIQPDSLQPASYDFFSGQFYGWNSFSNNISTFVNQPYEPSYQPYTQLPLCPGNTFGFGCQDVCANYAHATYSFLSWVRSALNGVDTPNFHFTNTADRVGFCKVPAQTGNWDAMGHATLVTDDNVACNITIAYLNPVEPWDSTSAAVTAQQSLLLVAFLALLALLL